MADKVGESYAMTMMRRTCLAALLTASLAGCAAPGPMVQSSGTLPRDTGYAFAEEAAPPPQLATPLAQALAEQGLHVSDSPHYLVQVEYSRPPAKTGTLIADQADPQWQRAPSRRGGPLSRMSLSVTDIATGTEVYRAAAWQRPRGKADDSAQLLQAALTPPPPPAR
ncbi:MAG TPA: hypothetical protein VF503_31725 [Sphingobium sp.]|uniref:hypothetical protein n=1 Tax=Sphingobium sp. TaxID=1912891 RepID=UPI002ED43E4F